MPSSYCSICNKPIHGNLGWYSHQRMDEFNDGVPNPNPLTDADARRHAELDMEGAKNADFLVLLPFPELMGALLEVGIALAHGRQIFIIGEIRFTVFWKLPNVYQLATVEELFALLQGANDECAGNCPDCGVHVYCHGCSVAGGADRPIYHAPPVCA